MKKHVGLPLVVGALLLCCLSRVSFVAAQGFDQPFDIRERVGINGSLFSMTQQGADVYVNWVERSSELPWYRVKLARSTNGGATFGEPAVLYTSDIIAIRTPELAVADGNVYVAFVLGLSPHDLFFCRSNEKAAACRLLLFDVDTHIDNLRLAAAGNRVYLAWNGLFFGHDVHLVYSTDGGLTFSDRVTLTNDPSVRRNVSQVTARGEHVYIRWGVETQQFLAHGRVAADETEVR